MKRFCSWLFSLILIPWLSSGADRPNILLIYADDIGYEALNCYGGLDFETPELNRMAEEGILFQRAYASPVCTPSRVSLHTGLYTTRHGFTGVLPVHRGTDRKVDFTKWSTFAQLLRESGYLTSTTGKWQLATLEVWPDHIRESGFDSWCIWQIWREGKKTLRHWTPTFNEDGEVREDITDRFGPDVLVDYVAEQMEKAVEAEKPFLIVHNELLPHDPIVETPADRVSGEDASLGNMIHYMDRLVGQLLDTVEELGIRESTYVFFMGDNGTHEADFENPRFGEPDELEHTRHTRAGLVNGGKYQLSDAGTHVPLLVWGPEEINRGSRSDDLVDVVDLFPTFCDLARVQLPESLTFDGRSIRAQIHGREGIVRGWVHHAIGKGKGREGGENLFDGEWRLFRESGELWDARDLPREKVVEFEDLEAESAARKLEELFESITQEGRVPPVPFSDPGD
ncbi:MAG: sulfatase-like hydrolase/transferase [Verrucomicrobiota bacterium]